MPLRTIDVQFGLSTTTANNFILRTPDDGSFRLSRGVIGSTSDVFYVDKFNNMVFQNSVVENANVIASAPSAGVNTYNIISNGFVYHTSNNTTNFTLNMTGPTFLGNGQAITMTLALSNGANAFYPNVIQVESNTSGVSTKWLSSAPTGGNANSIDLYSFSVIKTSNITYTVFASQAKYA
jgi:hypothetical protein